MTPEEEAVDRAQRATMAAFMARMGYLSNDKAKAEKWAARAESLAGDEDTPAAKEAAIRARAFADAVTADDS